MAIKLNADALAPITFVNPWEPEDKVVDQVFNTGLAACGCPHADEKDEFSGKAIIPDEAAYEVKHIASIRLYKNNEYVELAPGDELTITPKTANEAIYYLGFKDTEILKITAESRAAYEAVVEEAPEEVPEDEGNSEE